MCEIINNETPVQKFEDYAKNTLTECLSLMVSKSHDYSEATNRYSNFEFASKVAGSSSAKTAILILIGIKVARLTQLVAVGKTPQNESVKDTIIDLINYVLILGGWLQGLQ